MLSIRNATREDVPLLMRFIFELAEYEHSVNAVVITEQSLARDGFGPHPKFHALLADWDGQSAGYAVFFEHYSTWRGSPELFLEDLFVREAFRSRGIGKALLSELARTAQNGGYFGLRWDVLDWNKRAIEFYKSLGGEFLDEWRFVLLSGEPLRRVAGE
jgi:GNAT superfamily N-acetyltransferase